MSIITYWNYFWLIMKSKCIQKLSRRNIYWSLTDASHASASDILSCKSTTPISLGYQVNDPWSDR